MIHSVTATSAERTAAARRVTEIREAATDTWVAEEIGRLARLVAVEPTAYRLEVLGGWVTVLADRGTAKTGLVTAAADDHVRQFLNAPREWQAEQTALAATIVAHDPTPYTVSLLRAWARTLTVRAESPLVAAAC